MASPSFTSVQEIADLLRRTVRINILQDEPTTANQGDVSFAHVDSIRNTVEAKMLLRLGKFYQLPMALVNVNTIRTLRTVATYLAGYEVYLVIMPQMTVDALPAAVLQWKVEGDDTMDRIAPDKREGLIDGRDPILGGETLRVSAGTPGRVAAYVTSTFGQGGVQH